MGLFEFVVIIPEVMLSFSNTMIDIFSGSIAGYPVISILGGAVLTIYLFKVVIS
jgi:hypothetical protein